MTVVKTVGVRSSAHMKSLSGYLDTSNEKHEVLAIDSNNLAGEPSGWAREFAATRAAYGHDVAGKAGSKPTLCLHQVLAFSPTDYAQGKVTPDVAMKYTREWVERYYPNQEACWTLHLEKAKDGSERLASHIAINRTDLTTGKRLDEGPAKAAKATRAARIREMDEQYGFSQLEKGRTNTREHHREQSRGEQKAREIGKAKNPHFETDLDHVRRVVKESVSKVAVSDAPNKMRALNETLEARGVHMRMSQDRHTKQKDVVFEYKPTYKRYSRGQRVDKASISGYKLGRGYSLSGIVHKLEMKAVRAYTRALERAIKEGVDDAYGQDN